MCYILPREDICKYRQLAAGKFPGQKADIWTTSLVNELGRLANGVGIKMPTGNETI